MYVQLSIQAFGDNPYEAGSSAGACSMLEQARAVVGPEDSGQGLSKLG
jgi:hypothetical protein